MLQKTQRAVSIWKKYLKQTPAKKNYRRPWEIDSPLCRAAFISVCSMPINMQQNEEEFFDGCQWQVSTIVRLMGTYCFEADIDEAARLRPRSRGTF